MIRIFIFCSTMLLLSCNTKDDITKGFTKTTSGFYYKVINANDNNAQSSVDKISFKNGDIAKLHLAQYIDDSLLNSTYEKVPDYVKIDTSNKQVDYTELLPKLHVGDSVQCLFNTKEIIKNADKKSEIPLFLQKGEFIKVFFRIKEKFTIDSIAALDLKKEKQFADSSFKVYETIGLQKSTLEWNDFMRTIKEPLINLNDGLYVQVLKNGTGAKIKKGDVVAVNYTGKLTNGNVFEATLPNKPFKMHVLEGTAIDGFDRAIASLKIGDEARLYIPASLAYKGQNKGKKLPAFSNLIFDVKVEASEDKGEKILAH
jgi:FKBP-type peptidyl-prolyl cis-trans isomerase FkpA